MYLGDLMVPEGGTAKLICKAKGYPKPTITWRKEDGSPIIIKEGQGGKRKRKMLVFRFYIYLFPISPLLSLSFLRFIHLPCLFILFGVC